MDSYPELVQFILTVAGSGCNNFIIHARKAWLQGLSPKQNREVPPLKYEYVYRLKQEFPEFTVVLNGGVKSHEEMHLHLNYVDGVMLGREAYHNPYLLSGVDQIFYEENARSPSREQLVHSIIPYIEQELMAGTKLHSITRHLHGLFLGCPGARTWRRYISQHDYQPDADASILLAALEKMAHPASQAVI